VQRALRVERRADRAWPRCASMARRSNALWRACAASIASGCCSIILVEPSTSVNRKVTPTVNGSSAGIDVCLF